MAAPGAAEFGLRKPAAQAVEGVESHIPGTFRGWSANSVIRLANGQEWQVADGSWLAGEWTDPRVRVRRGLFGGYRLQIEGLNREIGVRRVR